MATTKTIQDVTYYQDPSDPDLWYDDETQVGSGRTAWDLSELKDMRDKLGWWTKERATADVATYDGACLHLEATDEINSLEEQIEILEGLAG